MHGQGIDSSWNPVTPGSLSAVHRRRETASTTDDCIPLWVECLAGPVWVSGADQTIRYINSAALGLLGMNERECIGKPCHEVIAGIGEEREKFCSVSCPVRKQLERHRRIKPARLDIFSRSGERHRMQVVVVPVHGALTGNACLVHCGIDDDRAQAIEEYLEKITRRTPNRHKDVKPINNFRLTRREREILELLTEDETLWSIAHKLHVSYTTVRNHVQHILAKLGVHSIIEAVAFHLVARK